jgi:carboxypeptidase family protein
MSAFFNKRDVYNSLRALLLALFALLILLSGQRVGAQPVPTGGPIHGFVAVKVPAVQELPLAAVGSSIQPGASIVVPNINVTAQNVATNASSAAVVTNPQGFFQTPNLPPGRYRICVSGAGFLSSCDDATVNDPGPYTLMNHFVLIRPAETAIIGTVTLAPSSSVGTSSTGRPTPESPGPPFR